MKIKLKTTNIYPGAIGRLSRILTGLLLLWLFAAPALAGTVTATTGGTAIPSNTTFGCDAAGWTSLTGPTYAETNRGEVSTGTIILNVPAGFEFNTAATVTVLITGNNRANRNINNLATGTSAAVTSITATQITFTVTASSTRTNTLTWQGIQVRPTASSPQASGNITSSGTATLNGVIAGTTNFGTLTEVASTPVCTAGGGTTGSVTANPTLCVTDSSNGSAYPWGGLTNVGAQDNTYATATGVNSSVTQYLVCTNYGFAIPAGATIDGISVGPWVNSTYTFTDNAMQLVKANAGDTAYVVQPTNLATGANTFPNGGGAMAATPTQLIYGGSTNLWGNTWSVADINAVNFGAAFAAQRGPYNTTQTAGVDAMPITVYYTLPPTPPQPLADYRMDEASWNGTANEVTDSSGNGNNAQSFNIATTDGTTPAIAGTPGTCRYGVFDNGTTITSGYIQTPLPNFTTDFTVTAWIRTTNNTISGQRILIDDQSNSGGYGISLGDGGTGRVRFYSRGINPVILDSTYTIANNTWYFVAAVADITNRKRTLYVFNSTGALLGSNSDAAFTGTWGTDAGPVSLGGETNASGEPPANFHFHGNLDEVQVFNSALSQTQLATIATQTHACPISGPDHLEIQHATGTGLTCAASMLTIKACSDAACTTGYTGGVSGTLSASGTPTVNWDGTTGGATGSGFIIPAGSSSVTKNVQVATAGSVVFGVATATPAPAGATSCNFGSPACTFTANTAGFIFSNTTTGNIYTIPSQVSGIATPTLYLRAVQALTTNPAVCTPAIINSTSSVNMGYTCNNPAACQPGNLTTINTTAIAPGGTAVSLSFDGNGSAPITVRYDDVGQITLGANTTVTPFGGATAITLTGSSNPFKVAPHHFGISGVTAGPIKAGNNFSATVTAYNGLAIPTATANFGQETTPEGATLSFTKCQPTGASASSGTFSGSLGAFASGAATASNLNWSEVGNGDLTATLASGSYLGSGLSATGNTGTGGTVCNGGGAGNVGRFVPDHFDTSVTGPMACPSGLICPPVGGLVYSGQPFTVNVYAYAKNATGTNTLKNYDGTASTTPNFAKAVTLTAWDALGSTTTQNPPSGSDTLNNSAVPAASFTSGTTTLGTPATPSYTFNTTPTAPTDIYLRAADADATSLRGATSVEGGVKVVSGRIQLSNAHGSELLDLPINATAQYWDGTGYVTSSTDSVSSLSTAAAPAGDVTFANCQPLPPSATPLPYCPPATAPTPVSVVFGSGTAKFTLAKPGANNTGSVDLSIPAVTGASCLVAPTPLGCYLPSNVARATFGVYSSNKNFIYLREQY